MKIVKLPREKKKKRKRGVHIPSSYIWFTSLGMRALIASNKLKKRKIEANWDKRR